MKLTYLGTAAAEGDRYLLETNFIFEMYEGLYPQMRALFDTFTVTG